MGKGLNLAIVGATGLVGQEIIKTLEERDFAAADIKFYASSRSAGKRITFNRKGYTVEDLKDADFKKVDIALFSAGSRVSKEYAPIASKAGCLVIDNSSAWRMDKEVPLVVPEVNPKDIEKSKGIIANPNCSTIQMVVALKPLHDFAQIERVVVTTFQAVSGTGQDAIAELKKQIQSYHNHEQMAAEVYPYQIAFNVLPHIDVFLEDGSTKEEEKMVRETQKILDKKIKVSATTVRVPVFIGHSESVNIQTKEKLDAVKARELLESAPGIKVIDEPEENKYPTPILSAGSDECYVGRIRNDNSVKNGLNIWVVADNLRKGASLNAVQLAELAVKENLAGN